jgi:molybdate transport system ATP-binding protein
LLATGLHRSDLLRQPVTAVEQRRIASMLTLCRLTALKARRFLSLSYGQKRIALLARALVQKPDWLLLDEFYNGLDVGASRAHRWNPPARPPLGAVLGGVCASGGGRPQRHGGFD